MAPISISGFKGANLAFDERLLSLDVGSHSLNQRPGYGDLRPWNEPGQAVATVPTSPQRMTIYRMGQDVAGEANYWLGWNSVVSAVRGFESGDVAERTYFAGAGTPKWTDASIALSGGPPYPQGTRELGVPAPATAIAASINTAATGTAQAFQWVYTFVNDLGWESRPSPPSGITQASPGTTFDLSGFDVAPAGNYGVNRIRIYRYVPGAGTDGGFFFLREFAIGALPSNPVDDARAVGTAPIETSGWRMPPSDGHSLVKMWGGMLAMASGNTVHVCEPYKHYAWPLAYELQFPAKVIALAVWGQQLLVLTTGDAHVVVGSSPEGLDEEPTRANRACSSPRGVVEFNEGDGGRGVVWPSEEGLCWYGDGGFRNLTCDQRSSLLTREQWQAMSPSTMVASRHLGLYICFYNDGASKGFVIDPRNPEGVYFLSRGYDAVFRDPITDRLYVLDGGSIRRWGAGEPMTAVFRSKRVQLPTRTRMSVVQVVASSYPVGVRFWADGVLRLDRSAPNDRPLRPTGGWLADEVQVEASTTGRVLAIRLAANAGDLARA